MLHKAYLIGKTIVDARDFYGDPGLHPGHYVAPSELVLVLDDGTEISGGGSPFGVRLGCINCHEPADYQDEDYLGPTTEHGCVVSGPVCGSCIRMWDANETADAARAWADANTDAS